jgi:CMP-N,N'-diacetyllegionaminic acid synthase
MTEVLAIIPARAGSKGVPGKNLYPVGGRPLIAWSIEQARRSSSVTRVVVSTDGDEIARVAVAEGAEVPVLRPSDLAADETPGTAPIVHMTEWLAAHDGYVPDAIVVLQPTSPLRAPEDIDAACALMRARQADAVASICLVAEPAAWQRSLDAEGRLIGGEEADEALPRQAYAPKYVLNGAIYLVRRDVLLARRSLYGERTFGYVMPRERSLDIDTRWDLHVADLVLRYPFQP